MEYQNPIDEARRYVVNAEEVINKGKYDPETKLYKDKKYVRMAGDTLRDMILCILQWDMTAAKKKRSVMRGSRGLGQS